MRTMMRRTELGANTKVFFRVMSHPVKWARTVTANTQNRNITPLVWATVKATAGKEKKKKKNDTKKTSSVLPGRGKKEKIRSGTTHNSAKAYSTPMTSTRIFSDTWGVQNTTKQSWTQKTNANSFVHSLPHNRVPPPHRRHASLDFISSLTQGAPD